mgnify:CR=1 FL=1
MKKHNLFLIISMIFVVFLLTTGCGGNPAAPPIEEDFINIISVTPDSGLVDGVDTNFTVVIEYNLYSYTQGEVQVGFNNGESINSFRMVNLAYFLENKGYGTHEFKVTIKPKNWGSQGDFSVAVILDEVPWVSNYVLASDTEILTFQ